MWSLAFVPVSFRRHLGDYLQTAGDRFRDIFDINGFHILTKSVPGEMAEKGWSRTIRATYATQLGFEDRYGHRAVSFPVVSLSAYHESRGESSNGKR